MCALKFHKIRGLSILPYHDYAHIDMVLPYNLIQELYQYTISAIMAGLAIQKSDDSIGVRTGEAVSKDGDTTVGLNGHIAEQQSGATGNGAY